MSKKQVYKTWIEIDQSVLKNNLSILKKAVAPQGILAMVKCNAYGHGLVQVAKILSAEGIRWFGVDNWDEGIALRKAGIKSNIMVMINTPPANLSLMIKYNLAQAVYDFNTLDNLVSVASLSKKARVHLKIDTGMSRQGILPDELPKYLKYFKKHQDKIIFEGVLSHLSNADDLKNSSYTIKQLTKFNELLPEIVAAGFKLKNCSIANSSGALSQPSLLQSNVVRLGISLYGLEPSADFVRRFKELGLKPVLTWKTRLMQIKKIPAGAGVGYNLTEKVKKETLIGVLPVGYYDGIPRAYSSRGYALVNNEKCRFLGRVSMNMSVIDLSGLKTKPKQWQEVILIGQDGGRKVTASDMAKTLKTINYEVVTRINPLIPRVIV